jgi:hypothetical protein
LLEVNDDTEVEQTNNINEIDQSNIYLVCEAVAFSYLILLISHQLSHRNLYAQADGVQWYQSRG